MKETMGQIIRRLRKERNLTQDELAEQLNLSPQAVSRWENGTGMPDISQIVPLSSIFGVTTDVLFGVHGTTDEEEAGKILEQMRSYRTEPVTTESLRLMYRTVQDGLRLYPTNPNLLRESLELSMALAYPDDDLWDRENGRTIYEECIRQAKLVIENSPDISQILRARMILVLLHAAYGNIPAAKEQAEKFPYRSDFTALTMNGYIAHWEKDYRAESVNAQWSFLYSFEAALDSIVNNGCARLMLGEAKEAAVCFEKAAALLDAVFGDEKTRVHLHYRERGGDLHVLLASAYEKLGDRDGALRELEKMADYDLAGLQEFYEDSTITTPLLADTGFQKYFTRIDGRKRLLAKLNDPMLDPLRSDQRFTDLINRINTPN